MAKSAEPAVALLDSAAATAVKRSPTDHKRHLRPRKPKWYENPLGAAP